MFGWGRARRNAVAEARRQEALAALGQRALEGAESKDLVEHATELVARILAVSYSAVLAWEPDDRRLRVQAGIGWRAGVVERALIDTTALPETAAAWCGLEPVVFDALAQEPRMAEVPLLRNHEIVSGLSVAIVPRGRPFGVLAVYAAERRCFQPPEIEFVRGVARLLAIALGREYGERALFEEMQMSTVLAHVGRELMSCTDGAELLARTCQLTAQALRCDHSVTWLRGAEGDDFRPVAADGLPEAQWATLATVVLPPAAVAPLLAELAERETIRIAPTSERQPLVGALLARSGIRTAVFAPIYNGEVVIGLQMSGHRDRAGEIAPPDERVAHGIAQLTSTALMNARVVAELARASQLKSEFVSTMSHELRTPLNIIIGYTDMLRDAMTPEEQAPLLAHVRKASHELLELIDGTLNLNRLAAGGDVACFTAVALGELWRELGEDFAVRTPETAVTLRWEASAGLVIHTDRRKLKIVLRNLIANALKFTPAGEVAVVGEPVGDQCRITVRDTGIGISPAALPHIFEMFRQADSSETRSYGGAGLGLYIVKSLLTQLDGQIQVESLPGQGSIFTVVLPIEVQRADAASAALAGRTPPDVEQAPRGEAPPDRATPCPIHTPRRLLFADDLPLNRLLVQRFITREFPNVEVLEACDGEQAIAMFDAHRPDLVLLDLHMPELDGWQAASAIRRRPGALDVPILALSVDASPSAEANAVRAGFQEFIAKPISDYSALKARLQFWLSPRGARGARGATMAPVPSANCDACRNAATNTVAA
jgi:signal transduction histidine kinase/CheY-like chemotaxis protein